MEELPAHLEKGAIMSLNMCEFWSPLFLQKKKSKYK